MIIGSYMYCVIIAAAALATATMPLSEAALPAQQLGNLRLRKDFVSNTSDLDKMKEIIKSKDEEIDSLKAMVHRMEDELADQRRKLTSYDASLLPCVPSASVSICSYVVAAPIIYFFALNGRRTHKLFLFLYCYKY